MKLKQFIDYLKPHCRTTIGNISDVTINGIKQHHSLVENNDVFVAIKGSELDGSDFIYKAIANGACAIITNGSVEHITSTKIPVCIIPDLEFILGDIAAYFYNYPSEELRLIGITGTNGKTSISYALANMLPRCAVMGTLGVGLPESIKKLANTTPIATTLQHEMRLLLEQGIDTCALEVSSHGIALGRINSCEFAFGIYSNLSPDHIDFHGTMADYWQAKESFFIKHKIKHMLINADCPYGRSLLARFPKAKAYSLQYRDDLASRLIWPSDVQVKENTTDLVVNSPWGRHKVDVAVTEQYNISNFLAAFSIALWIHNGKIDSSISKNFKLPPGRMQFIKRAGKPHVVIDFAHTPQALEVCLKSLQDKYTRNNIWCIFGCGGDRDKKKRPMMYAVAEQYCDNIILTADNPRSEPVSNIIADMLQDSNENNKCKIIEDRTAAIQYAIATAAEDDVILIAGRGHEEYQILATKKVPLVDTAVANIALERS